MSRLCFGTFGHILRLCKRGNISNPTLIGTMTRTVDPNCQYINPDNKSTVSRLLSCDGNLSHGAMDGEEGELGKGISNVVIKAQQANKNDVIEGFREDVLPLLDPDKTECLVLALLELIENDETLASKEVSFEQYVGEKKDTLLTQDVFFLDELLAGLFLFITATGIDNRDGKESLEMLTTEYIDSIKNVLNIKVFVSNPIDQSTYEESVSEEVGHTPNHENIISDSRDVILNYLQNAKQKYEFIKTLLYSNEPKPFYEFYVCNNVEVKIKKPGRFSTSTEYITIKDANVEKFSEISRFVILSGTGGLGKSMMMRHLLLDTIKRFEELKTIPIFIPVKDFDESVDNLFEYVYSKISPLASSFSPELLKELLENGSILLLFDGLDEIMSEQSRKFELELENFTDRFSKNHFVISSRPYFNFVSFSRFFILELQPFTREQAINLIDKLEFRPDESAIKQKFKDALEEKLYYSHKAFTENPLLLTIMLMTFEQYAEVPSKMHIFYREAFSVLSSKHDASKGAYKRTLSTKLTIHRFEEYFSEFCWHSYFKEKFELTEDEFYRIYESLKEPKKFKNENASAGDFLMDLCSNLCIMYLDVDKYHFIHRSFQEYFCALFLSRQKDRMLKSIGDLFEGRKTRMISDKTFEMFYDMIPDKVEEYIFIPFLEELYKKCDEANGYPTFLEIMYPYIHYQHGETTGFMVNSASSFLFTFMKRLSRLYYPECDDFPHVDSLVDSEYVWAFDEESEEDVLIEKDELDSDYEYYYGVPDTVGWDYTFDVTELFANPDQYKELLECLNNDDCDFKKEYVTLRAYLAKLQKKQNPVGETLLELL